MLACSLCLLTALAFWLRSNSPQPNRSPILPELDPGIRYHDLYFNDTPEVVEQKGYKRIQTYPGYYDKEFTTVYYEGNGRSLVAHFLPETRGSGLCCVTAWFQGEPCLDMEQVFQRFPEHRWKVLRSTAAWELDSHYYGLQMGYSPNNGSLSITTFTDEYPLAGDII